MLLPKQVTKPGRAEAGERKIKKGIWKKMEVEFVEGQISLKLRTDKARDRSALTQILPEEAKTAKIMKEFDRFGHALLQLPARSDVIEVCRKLAEHPDVVYAEPNMMDRMAVTVPNDPDYGQQWPLPLIGMPNAWDLEQGNANVLIAVLDSGIPMSGAPLALSHPDLSDAARIILGPNLVSGGANPRDDNGHGTHVAGIASAQGNNATGIAGMSWGTRLYIVKVFDQDGNTTHARFRDGVHDAVDYADAHGLRLVINYSGGGTASATKEDGVQYTRNHDCVLVAAAGNDNQSPITYPAAYSSTYDNVIAVTATDSADAFAPYSNRGAEANVAAPGTNIYSTMPNYPVTLTTTYGFSQNYDHLDGTSMSTPHVSGLAALLLSEDPALTAPDVRDTIENTALDLGDAGWDDRFGFGRINALAALQQVGGPVPCAISKEVCLKVVEATIPCAFKKEFCLYLAEVCSAKAELIACRFIQETIPCHWILEGGGCLPKIETLGPCAFAMEGGCLREGVIYPPEELIIRRQPVRSIQAPIQASAQLRHARPLTRRVPLSYKRRLVRKTR